MTNKEIKLNFKPGDIIYISLGFLAIFKNININYDTNELITYYYTIYSIKDKTFINNINAINCEITDKYFRLATEEEKDIVITALKERAKNGSEYACKLLKDIFNINNNKQKYILVEWPEIQNFMEHPRFNECIFCTEIEGHPCPDNSYMIPEDLYNEIHN